MTKRNKAFRFLLLVFGTGLTGSSAAPLDAPRAVMNQILAGLTKAGGDTSENNAYDPCPNLCDPTFTAIKRRSDLLGTTPDEDIPYIYNVFCHCEDYDNQTFRLVSDRFIGVSRYEARIVGSDKGQKPWTIVLIPIGGAWKISDVIDDTGSVRAGMLNALRGKKH
jgi:hypothetical protein